MQIDLQVLPTARLIDIKPFDFSRLNAEGSEIPHDLPDTVYKKVTKRISSGKTFGAIYKGFAKTGSTLVQITINRRNSIKLEDRGLFPFCVIVFGIQYRDKDLREDNTDNPHPLLKPKLIDTNVTRVITTNSSYRRLYKLVKNYEFRAKNLDQAKGFIQMFAKQNQPTGGDFSFQEGFKEKIKQVTNNQHHLDSLIKKTHVYSTAPLTPRPNGVADSRTGFKTYDTILRTVMSLDKSERVVIDQYYHPYLPYTWKAGIITDDDYCKKFLEKESVIATPTDAKDALKHPYYIEYEGTPTLIDEMTSNQLLKIYLNQEENSKYDTPEYKFNNSAIYDGVKIMAEQSLKKDTRTITNPSEFCTFIELLAENQPHDEYGFPIEITSPKCNLEAIAAHGPASTAGGVDYSGARQTKTNLYTDTIDQALRIMQACTNLANEVDQSPQTGLEAAKNRKNRIIMSPLLSSTKNEIIKRGKKLRFFTLTQAPFECLETFVYAQILDNSKNVTYDIKGGNRLMIGNSLERGYGQFMVNTMIMRNGENLEQLNNEIKNFNPNRTSPDFNDKDYYTKYQGKPYPTIGAAKSFVTDYSSQEFQHNTIHRLLSLMGAHKFYTATPENNTFHMVMAVIGELTTQVDVDLGGGTMLLLPPGHVGSGCKMTLLGNGNSNKFELNNATLEAAISVKRGYYYTKNFHEYTINPNEKTNSASFTEYKDGLYNKTKVPSDIDFRTIQNLHDNPVFQGDDGYLATLDGDVPTFHFVIDIMRDTYANRIKADVHNLFAVHDKKGYDVRDAGDFLKIKPTITKKGFFFIRDTSVALQKLFFPNSLPFNAVTSLFAAISQSYTSCGNFYSYKLAHLKQKILAAMIAKENINVTEADKDSFIALMQSRKEYKDSGAIDQLLLNGFTELDFDAINERFLKPDISHLIEKQEETSYYRSYGMSKGTIISMRLGYTK